MNFWHGHKMNGGRGVNYFATINDRTFRVSKGAENKWEILIGTKVVMKEQGWGGVE